MADRQRERRQEQQEPTQDGRGGSQAGGVPKPRKHVVVNVPKLIRECANDVCALRLEEGWDDELCGKCRSRANQRAELYQQQQEAFASSGPAPF
ncbi:hypothetical protein [Streptomyces sp. NPDC002640]